jgi:hypothetical protein
MPTMKKWYGIPSVKPANISQYLTQLIFLKNRAEKQNSNTVYDNLKGSANYALGRILNFT